MTFQLPQLSYNYDSLEPHLDAKTLEIHHSKHHQAYTDNFNKALAEAPDLQGKSAEEILKNLDQIPETVKTAITNHGGGYLNHKMFWETLSPERDEPSPELSQAIEADFSSFDAFKEKFTATASTQFGSGWTWLVKTPEGKLEITTTLNQGSPLSEGKTPLLPLDIWEHAYYLKFQNRRAEFISAWWNVVNWKKVSELFGN